jgi:hypothetical protein
VYERGHRVTWCRFLCEPVGNKGACGRLAPHSIVGKTQAAIAAFNEARGLESASGLLNPSDRL